MIGKPFRLLIIFLFFSESLQATGFYSPAQSALQLGARTALTTSRNAESVAANPAAIGFLPKGWQVSSGLLIEQKSFEWSGFAVNSELVTNENFTPTNQVFQDAFETELVYRDEFSSANTQNPVQYVPSPQVVWSGEKWNYGFALKVPFDSLIRWEDEWGGRDVVQQQQIRVTEFNNNLVYQLHPSHSIGVGHGMNLVQFYHQRATPDGSGKHITAEGVSWANNLHVSYMGWVGPIVLAANFHTHIPVKMSGSLTLDADGILYGTQKRTSDATISFGLPRVSEVAIGWKNDRKAPRFEVEFSIMEIGWEFFRELDIKLRDRIEVVRDFRPSRSERVRTEHFFNNTLSYRASFQYHIVPQTIIMLGAELGDRPTESKRLSPAFPYGKRVSFGFGVEHQIQKQHRITGSFAFTRFDQVSRNPNDVGIEDPIARDPATGSYSGISQAFAFAYHYHFL